MRRISRPLPVQLVSLAQEEHAVGGNLLVTLEFTAAQKIQSGLFENQRLRCIRKIKEKAEMLSPVGSQNRIYRLWRFHPVRDWVINFESLQQGRSILQGEEAAKMNDSPFAFFEEGRRRLSGVVAGGVRCEHANVFGLGCEHLVKDWGLDADGRIPESHLGCLTGWHDREINDAYANKGFIEGAPCCIVTPVVPVPVTAPTTENERPPLLDIVL